jgi:CheY-like chemotaxis protein
MTITPAPVPNAAPDTPPPPDTRPGEAKAPPTFLYVEDDQLCREIMQLLIVKVLGYPKLIIFEESANFMERVRALPSIPDVIFLDIQVHPHDGYEMLKMLRSDPAYQNRKIIAMTASVMATDVEALKKAGFNGLIGKPIMRRVFPDLLKQILEGEDVWFVS